MHHRLSLFVCGCALALSLCAAARVARASETNTRPAEKPLAASPGGAEAYCQWLASCLDGLERDLPQIAASAEAAAQLYVAQDGRIAAHGDMGFAKELNNRAGGLMRMEYASKVGADWKGIVLAAIRDDQLGEDLAATAKFRKQGCMVVAIARRALIEQARQQGAEFDSVVLTHAAEHGGMFQAGDGRWVVATDTTANIAAAWTWTAEFVAACTRLAQMPTMFQSYAVAGSKERAEKLRALKFHDHVPEKIEAGVLGRRYLQALRQSALALHAGELADIRAAARLSVAARRAGRGVYLYAQNHALLFRLPCAHDGGYFTQINDGWVKLKKGIALGPGDLVFCIGYDSPFRDEDWRKFDQQVRPTGATLVWSIATYKKDQIATIPAEQILIDQQWAFGDAVADVAGYDIKILPTSGVLAEAVLWMTAAEIHRLPAAATSPK